MTLAAILVVYFLSVGNPAPLQEPSVAAPQSQASSAQSGHPAPASPEKSPQPQPQTRPNASKPSSRRHKKPVTPDCATKPLATTEANKAASSESAPTKANAAAQTPCPTPKKVIRNGGAPEPEVQLKGASNTAPASNPRSTEDLTQAANDNLKKLAGRELTAAEQETVSQIKEFMEQSKAAVAAGDLEQGHNLAVKARLLSDELVKP